MMHIPSSQFADRMFKVANLIAPLTAINFNMAHWTKPECGSPSCMAGHAVWLDMFGRPVAELMKDGEYDKALREYRRATDSGTETVRWSAGRYFGIDEYTGHVLFVPARINLHGGCCQPIIMQTEADTAERNKISGRWAANTLRHLADSGTVDWTKMKEAA